MGRLTNAETTALTACSYILDCLKHIKAGNEKYIDYQELENVQNAVDGLLNAPPPGLAVRADESAGF